MIQANELRIGNKLLAPDGSIVTVENILEDSINQRIDGDGVIGSYKLDEYNGIPLTPEILEKCGFEWDIFWQGFADKRGRYYLQEANDNGYNMFNGKWKQQINWMKALEYLHQLQNLYFALTGEELTVKL